MSIISFLLEKVIPPKFYAKFIGVEFGKNCEIYRNVKWGTEPFLIRIGNNVRITSGVKFITHDGGVWVIRNLYKNKNIDVFGKIIIGNNCHIGWDAIILPGITIGDNCVIGAGAIVTKDVPSNTVVAGVPAKKIKTIDEYYHKVMQNSCNTKQMQKKEKKEFLIKKYK